MKTVNHNHISLCVLTLLFIGINIIAPKEVQLITRQIHGQYAADFSDDRVLMGSSHNVFVGKVIRQLESKDRGIGVEAQFEVEIIDNIKGELEGTVVVNQKGGISDGVLYTYGDGDVVTKGTGDDPYLLQPGSTYLMATRYSRKEGWYTLNPHPNGRELIAKNDKGDREELKQLAKTNKKSQKLSKAYESEIIIDADVKNDNVRNSFAAMTEKKQKEMDLQVNAKAVDLIEAEATDAQGTTSTPEMLEEVSPVVEPKEQTQTPADVTPEAIVESESASTTETVDN